MSKKQGQTVPKDKNKANIKQTAIDSLKLTWLKHKTFELKITIPQKEIKTAYSQALDKIAKQAELSGFRKGKTPTSLVEEKLGKNKVYEEVVNMLVPLYYQKAITKHQLRPIINPKIELIKMEENSDWEIKITACEAPEIKLGEYKKIIRGVTAKDAIWVPGKDEANPVNQANKSKKLSLVLDTLVKELSLELPQILVESERDRMLAKLLAQVQKLGLNLDQYAQSNQKTVDGIKKEYYDLSEKNLKIEFILQKIALSEKLDILDTEIDKYIAQIKDENIKAQLNTPQQKEYLKLSLLRQKTIDFLLRV